MCLKSSRWQKVTLVKLPKYKNILAGGCSFTQDGIGGAPPTSVWAGGNSFRHDVDYEVAIPRSWASMVAQELDPESFTNVAVASQGIVATCTTICDMLEKFNYTPEDTLVIFNVTRLARFDVQCDFNTDNRYIPWTKDILDYSYYKFKTKPWKEHLVNTTIEQILEQSVEHLEKLLDYLHNNQYPFVFTLLDDMSHLPVIQKYKAHLVPLPHVGMLEFCRSIDEEDGSRHPTLAGHIEVAKLANKFIQEKYINTHD